MKLKYSSERNVLMLLSLLKAHGIRKVIASPGATNISLVASMQHDPYFEMYSSVDERSSAYLACGMAAESGQPVVLSCTGATASRNYIPGLTEAFYRKLPVLAVTSTQLTGRVGQMIPQVLDRSQQLKDMVLRSVQIPVIHNSEDAWSCNTLLNDAILTLTQNGGGPVHINIETMYSKDYSIDYLPKERVIRRYTPGMRFPNLPKGRICIFIGSHLPCSKELTNAIDIFCEKCNAVVLCDQTSNYHGKYRVDFSLLTSQINYNSPCKDITLLIHLGEISGAYPSLNPKKVWRVHADGKVCDPFKKLTAIFAMNEIKFFKLYSSNNHRQSQQSQIKEWNSEIIRCRDNIHDLPFSNVWIAKEIAPQLPENSVLHIGILNSLRSWNLFKITDTVSGYANTGGFGIDGCLSSAVGAALASPQKIIFCVIGDLAFFYDMNVLGNRHIKDNLRILIVNNGKGTEFRQFNHRGAVFGDEADAYIAAGGHFGKQSRSLVRHYAEDLGYKYIFAEDKKSFIQKKAEFLFAGRIEKSIIFEVFTDSEDESDATRIAYTCINDHMYKASNIVKKVAKGFLGERA